MDLNHWNLTKIALIVRFKKGSDDLNKVDLSHSQNMHWISQLFYNISYLRFHDIDFN